MTPLHPNTLLEGFHPRPDREQWLHLNSGPSRPPAGVVSEPPAASALVVRAAPRPVLTGRLPGPFPPSPIRAGVTCAQMLRDGGTGSPVRRC